MMVFSSMSACGAVDCSIVKTSCGIQSIRAVSLLCGSACDSLNESLLKIFWDILCIHVVSLQYELAKCDVVQCLIAQTSCGIQGIRAVSLQYGSACGTVECLIVKTSCDIQSIRAVSLQCGSACGAVEWLIVKTSCGIQSIHVVSLQYGLACDAVDCSIVKTSCGTQSIHAVSLQCGSACGAVE